MRAPRREPARPRPPVGLDDRPDDRQPETRPSAIAGASPVEPGQAVEDAARSSIGMPGPSSSTSTKNAALRLDGQPTSPCSGAWTIALRRRSAQGLGETVRVGVDDERRDGGEFEPAGRASASRGPGRSGTAGGRPARAAGTVLPACASSTRPSRRRLVRSTSMRRAARRGAPPRRRADPRARAPRAARGRRSRGAQLVRRVGDERGLAGERVLEAVEHVVDESAGARTSSWRAAPSIRGVRSPASTRSPGAPCAAAGRRPATRREAARERGQDRERPSEQGLVARRAWRGPWRRRLAHAEPRDRSALAAGDLHERLDASPSGSSSKLSPGGARPGTRAPPRSPGAAVRRSRPRRPARARAARARCSPGTRRRARRRSAASSWWGRKNGSMGQVRASARAHGRRSRPVVRPPARARPCPRADPGASTWTARAQSRRTQQRRRSQRRRRRPHDQHRDPSSRPPRHINRRPAGHRPGATVSIGASRSASAACGAGSPRRPRRCSCPGRGRSPRRRSGAARARAPDRGDAGSTPAGRPPSPRGAPATRAAHRAAQHVQLDIRDAQLRRLGLRR